MVWDILNWQTLVFESIYAGGLGLAFFLVDRRRRLHQENILRKLNEYQQRQERIDKSVRLNSFTTITLNLEMMIAFLEEDMRELDRKVIHYDHKVNYINQRLSLNSPYRLFPQSIDSGSNIVKWMIPEQLYTEIQSVTLELEYLSGKKPHFKPGENLVNEWRKIAVSLIPRAEQLRTRLLQIVAHENPPVLQKDGAALGWREFQRLNRGYDD